MKTRMMKLTAATLALTGALGTAAVAGSADVAVIEPAPVTPIEVAPVAPVGNWTGAYGGLSLGTSKGEALGQDENGAVYGVHGGYDYQFSNGLIAGGEIEYQGNDDLNAGGVEVDNVARAKAKLGYDLGRTMIYGTAGVSKIESNLGDATAPVYGIGAEYKVTDSFGVGAEYLNEDFDNLGATDTDYSGDTVNLRGTFRF